VKLYLNAGFGHKLGEEAKTFIVGLGFYGVRQDVLVPQDAKKLVRELSSVGLAGIYLVRDLWTAVAVAEATLGRRAIIELGNEPDSGRARDYHRWAMETLKRVREVNEDVSVYTGGITTTDRKRYRWLEELYALGIPDEMGCAIHTYRTTAEPDVPHKGYLSRTDEYEWLRLIVGPSRPVTITETGWHTARSKKDSFWCNMFGIGCQYVQFTEQQAAGFFEREVQIASDNTVQGVTLFQLNDGPDPDYYEHRFGIRAQDGREKPICQTIRRLTGVA
jgi:hypothetical protein